MIDHDRKLIFIHVPRTGGTSVEYALVGRDFWGIDKDAKHISMERTKTRYAKELASGYKTFSIARNPWNWMLSLYFSHEQKRARWGRRLTTPKNLKSWEEWLKKPTMMYHEQKFAPISEIASGADFWLKTESLGADLNRCLEALGHRPVHLARRAKRWESNNAFGRKKRTAGNFYTDKTKARVAKLLAADIKTFGYSFP